MLTYNETSNTFTSSLISQTVTHAFGTRMSGNGVVTQNIQKYLNSQKIVYKTIADPEQVHGDQIEIVSGKSNEEISQVKGSDGLITDQAGVVLTVITADCAPVIYFDVNKNIIGISHNGRKGTELKIAQKMIKKFLDLGSTIHDLRIAIGPSIGACCYPMNLVKENVEQLMESGLAIDQIDFFPFCTKCDTERFFSYRNSRDIPNFPEQFSFICL